MCTLITQTKRGNGQEVRSVQLYSRFILMSCLQYLHYFSLCNFDNNCSLTDTLSWKQVLCNSFFPLSFSLVIVGYGEIKKETTKKEKVFFEKKKVCNDGTARYLLELAQVDKYSVTNAFAAAVCRLPKAYDQGAYRRFIDNWGTVSMLTVL